PYGVRVVENGNVELSFYAKIILNGDYLVRQRMSRREIATLFLSLYENCPFQELLDVISDLKENQNYSKFPPVVLKRVNEIGLPSDTAAWLSKNNIWKLGDLVQKTETQMRNLPGFDDYALFRITERLTPLGLRFGMEVHGWQTRPEFPEPLLKKVDE